MSKSKNKVDARFGAASIVIKVTGWEAKKDEHSDDIHLYLGKAYGQGELDNTLLAIFSEDEFRSFVRYFQDYDTRTIR